MKDERIYSVDDNNYSIQWANKNGHLEVVKLLLNDERFIKPLISNKDDRNNLEVINENYVTCILADMDTTPTQPSALFLHERGKTKFSELSLEDQTIFRLRFC